MTPRHASLSTTGRWGSIRTHLATLIVIQLVFVLGLIGYSTLQDFRTAEREAAYAMEATARLAAEFTGAELAASSEELEQVQAFRELFTSPTLCSLMSSESQEAWNEDGFKSSFLMVKRDGSAICPESTGQGAVPDGLGSEPWFIDALAGSPVHVGPISFGPEGDPAMVDAISIEGLDIVVVSATHLNSIAAFLADKFASDAIEPVFTLTTADAKQELSDGVQGSRARIAGGASVPEVGWKLRASIDRVDALATANRALRERIIVAVAFVLLVLAAAIVISRRFARPIRSLARATHSIASGDTSAHVKPAGPTELVALGESFNHMLDVRNEAETALRKAYEAEQRAAVELREVDGMRNAFLMAISHELRTPLTSVVGYAQFLDDMRGEVSVKEMEEGIEAISTQAKRLERLLLDLLDVERLSRGVVEPKVTDCEVRKTMLNVVEEFDAQAQITIKTKAAARATVDPALVERMFENLIVNAIKHTPAGTRIWVGAVRRNGQLILSVEDEGEGVPQELKDAIFEPFKQGAVKSGSPGTGVGLSLVSQFAKLHGGRAWVEDRKGGGASFYVSLPAEPKQAKRAVARRAKKITSAAA